MADRRGDESRSSNNDRRESRDCGPIEKKDRTHSPPIFGQPDGRWLNYPVESVPEYPLEDLKVFLDDDPTSNEAIWLVRFEEEDGEWATFMTTIQDAETTDWSAVKAQILTTIFDEEHPQSKWISVDESRIESDDNLLDAITAIQDDEIEALLADLDWDSEGHQYQD
tara:strand:+ start:433 stop:933 length:501 start_codon:yes stop_codon:yes gene_type:complete